MSDSLTPNLGLTKPGIGASEETWGSKWNADLDLLDALLWYAMPVGAVVEYGGSTVPAGWLLCDGSAVSRATYAALFAAIATTFGAGNGSTTFNLPDLRGRLIAGAGNGNDGTTAVTWTLGQVIGAYTATITQATLPNYQLSCATDGTHSHNYQMPTPGIPTGAVSSPTNPAYTITGTVDLVTVADNRSAHSHTIMLGGSSTPFSIIKPTQASNRLIYAGP